MKPILMRAIQIPLIAALIACFLALSVTPVRAAPMIVVQTTQDIIGDSKSLCSLRAAVIAANRDQNVGGCKAVPGTDSIYVPEGTYALTITGRKEDASQQGDLDITTNLSIFGAGVNKTIIDGKESDRIFDFHSVSNATISNMTLTNGYENDWGGGAMLISRSGVSLYDVNIEKNSSATLGGGIAITVGSKVTIRNSQITGNEANNAAAIVNAGILNLSNSYISSNKGLGGNAMGAVLFSSDAGALNTIENVTISNNSVPAANITAGISVGGTSRLKMRNVTIVDNQGIGLEVVGGGQLMMSNSLIARQKNNLADCNIQPNAVFSNLGHNLASDATCKLNPAGTDKIVDDANLGLAGAPAVNISGTPTYALADNSPAEDAGSTSFHATDFSACGLLDQRFFFRLGLAKCDIGAFELDGIVPDKPVYLPLTLR